MAFTFIFYIRQRPVWKGAKCSWYSCWIHSAAVSGLGSKADIERHKEKWNSISYLLLLHRVFFLRESYRILDLFSLFMFTFDWRLTSLLDFLWKINGFWNLVIKLHLFIYLQQLWYHWNLDSSDPKTKYNSNFEYKSPSVM